MVLDHRLDKASVSFTAFGDLDFLRKGVDILLESRGPKAGMSLEECLGSVEVGDLLLASYAEVNLHLPRLQKMFVRLSGAPYLSCQGAGVCDFNPCQLGVHQVSPNCQSLSVGLSGGTIAVSMVGTAHLWRTHLTACLVSLD
ncbi:hypothetical protein P4O66_017193, partial [Electrophorus voltai]